MRFVVDAQLPPALAEYLRSEGHEAKHVFELNLISGLDAEIWEFANKSGATIVTKDEDFPNLLSLSPANASILWIRLGNCSNAFLIGQIKLLMPDIQKRFASGEKLLEIV